MVERAAEQNIAGGKTFDPAIEPARGFEQFDRADIFGQGLDPTALGNRQRQALQAVILKHQLGHFVGHAHQQRVALGFGQTPFAHFAVERDLDVDLIIRAIDAGAVVDKVGIDATAALRKLDPRGLRDGEVGAFADRLGLDLVGVDAEPVIGRIADVAVRLGRRFDVGADATEPDQVDRALENRGDQAGRVDFCDIDAECGLRFPSQIDRFL